MGVGLMASKNGNRLTIYDKAGKYVIGLGADNRLNRLFINDWLPFLEKEAKLGNPDAMSILSRMYRDGFGVKKDERTAEHYAEMERTVEPFEPPDDDDSNPWAKQAVEV